MDDSLKKRIDEHKASVVYDASGKMHVRSELINVIGRDETKVNKLISVVPKPDERIVKSAEVPHLFSELAFMNLLLTNACNLNCSYCYEQHRKDYGRFTPESLKKAYDWLHNINDVPDKVFQFFGGEPLVHKKLIKEFIEKYDCELEANYDNFKGIYVSMCTNGLLMDDEFIDFYFGKPYTHAMISLDTFNSAVDHREITPKQLETLVTILEKIVTKLGDQPQRVVIRCTLSEETATDMNDFVNRLYSIGIRNIVVHPLILDSMRGYIKWSDENWSIMRDGLFKALHEYKDLQIRFSEGVGQKEGNNCMVGSDLVAIDASGDFSGCYFFTNQKGTPGVGDTILGNVFEDTVYPDRHAAFQSAYNKMFETEEKCKTCDLQNYCYQCPAGNLDTGDKRMFRPDDMCQEVVKLYLDFQNDIYDKMFWRDVDKHKEQYSEEYVAHILADIGLDPKLTPKENYELIFGETDIELNNMDVQCFFLQTLILKRSTFQE